MHSLHDANCQQNYFNDAVKRENATYVYPLTE